METNISKIEANAIKYTMYTTMYLNDIAINCIKNLKPFFEHKDAHKESKKMYNALIKKTSAYTNMINDILGEFAQLQSFFYAEMDETYDELIENLYDAIYNAISPYLGEDSERVAKCELASIISETAMWFYKISSQSCKEYSNKVHRLNYLCIEEIFNNANNLSEWEGFLVRNKISLDLNKDEGVLSAFEAFKRATEDVDIFTKALVSSHNEHKQKRKVLKKRVMVKLGNDGKEFYDSITDCAKFFKVSITTIKNYAESGKKFKGVFTIKIVD